jgi:hypothetical protein
MAVAVVQMHRFFWHSEGKGKMAWRQAGTGKAKAIQ